MTAKLDIITHTHRSVVRPVFLTRILRPPIARGHRAYLDLRLPTPDRSGNRQDTAEWLGPQGKSRKNVQKQGKSA